MILAGAVWHPEGTRLPLPATPPAPLHMASPYTIGCPLGESALCNCLGDYTTAPRARRPGFGPLADHKWIGRRQPISFMRGRFRYIVGPISSPGLSRLVRGKIDHVAA